MDNLGLEKSSLQIRIEDSFIMKGVKLLSFPLKYLYELSTIRRSIDRMRQRNSRDQILGRLSLLIDVIRNAPRGFSVCNISLSAYSACPRRFRHACRGRSMGDNALRARTAEQDKADDTARNCMLSVASTRGHVRDRVRGRMYICTRVGMHASMHTRCIVRTRVFVRKSACCPFHVHHARPRIRNAKWDVYGDACRAFPCSCTMWMYFKCK